MSELSQPASSRFCTQCGAEIVSGGTTDFCPTCSPQAIQPNAGGRTIWELPTSTELAILLPQYDIESLLGRGGMGAVYKGMQKSLERPVAIKILSAEIVNCDATFVERFKNEARAMARLNHPSIVNVYESGETAGGILYIVMEFVEGTDVSRMIAKQGRLHTEHAMAITAHVCDALAYAHERGIIHRDIKPANIMVSYEGVVKVADFGLAKVSNDNRSGLTQSGVAMGTLHYMAPEALMLGSAVDQRADLYAVGVMLYQMLTGKLPQGMFKLPSQQIPGLDPRYDRIIAHAMQDDRELRYASALAMRRDLDAILTQPVLKVQETATKAPPALNTQARPQRPATDNYRPPPPRPVATPAKSGYTLLWATILVLAALAGWLYIKANRTALPNEASHVSLAATSVPPATSGAPPSAIDSTNASTAGVPTPSATPRQSVVEPGFTPLLDAAHTSGWQEFGGMKAAKVANGILTIDPPKSFCGTYWYSAKTFRDFTLRLQFRLESSGANSGVALRFAKPDEPDRKHYDIDLSDDRNPLERTGAIMFVKAPTANPQKVGEWNDMEITASGQHYRVTVNGVLVNDFTGDRSPSGYIGLDLGRPLVQFRNIRIKELGSINPPTPISGPATWTDTRGRSITATFKSLEDGNVVLDIAGKITSIPMGTLSPESQELARSYPSKMAYNPPSSSPASAPTAPPSRRPGAPRFDPDRFSSSIEMFEFNLPLEVFRGATTSGNVLSLRDLYSACLTREIILCMNSGRQSDIKWLKEEQQRVLDRVYPNGTVNKTLPYSLQKLQAAYWKAAVELDRILDSQQ